MPYYKFGPNDTFYNQIETHPQSKFLIYNGKIYYNNQMEEAGPIVEMLRNLEALAQQEGGAKKAHAQSQAQTDTTAQAAELAQNVQ